MRFLRVFFILLFVFANGQTEKRLALVVGNANYDKGELKNPVNDARLIASTLDSLGFEVILKENLSTRREMTAAIREFGDKRAEYEVAFVYYAGHGVQVDDENYLLPTQEVFEQEYDVVDNGVSVQNIMRYLREQTNEVNILVLDACRDNPFESNFNTTRSLKGNGLAKIPPPTGSLIAFSTDSGQTAPDGDGDNSVYTISLAKNMLLEDTSIDQVFRNVRSEVLEATNQAQRPVEATQLTGQTFYLNASNYEDDLLLARSLIFDDENYFEALSILEPIIEKNPLNIRARNLRQEVYYYMGEYEKALDELDQLISIDSSVSENYWDKGYALFAMDSIDLGLAQFKKSVEIDPLSSLANYHLYWAHQQVGDFDSAEKSLITAIDLDYKERIINNPNDSYDKDFIFNLAVLYHNDLEDAVQAQEQYLRILKLDESGDYVKKRNVLLNLGILNEYYFENYEKSLEYYLRELDNNPTWEAYYRICVFYLDRLDDKESALSYVNLGIDTYPEVGELYYHRANKLYFYDNPEAAEKDYLTAVRLIPEDIEALSSIASFYSFYERYDDALDYFFKILELDKNESFAKDNYIYSEMAELFFYYMNDEKKAFEYFEKEISISSDPSQGYNDRAAIYDVLGNFEMAEKDYSESIRLNPEYAAWYYNRAFFYYQNEYNEKALVDFKKAAEMSPSITKTYMLADTYQKIGLNKEDPELSKQMYEKALEKYLEVVDQDNDLSFTRENFLYNNIGALYENGFRDYAKALEYYKKHKELIPEDAIAYFNIAEIYSGLQITSNLVDPEKAIAILEELYKTDSLNIDVDYKLGRIYYEKIKDYEKAVFHFEKSTKFLETEEDIAALGPSRYYSLGLASEKIKDYEKALFSWLKSSELDVDNSFANSYYLYSNIGNLYENIFQNYIKALEYYNKEVEVDPDSYEGLQRRAELLDKKMMLPNEALSAYNLLVRRHSTVAEAYLLRSDFYKRSLKSNQALKDIEKALELAKKDPAQDLTEQDVLMRLAGFYFENENYDNALGVYLSFENSSLSENFLNNNSLYVNIGDVYKELKIYDKALQYYNKELSLYPNYIYAIMKRANFYGFVVDNKQAAESDYKKALALEPENNNLNLSYINFKFINNELDEVLRLADKAVSRDTKDPQGHYIKALVYKKKNNPLLMLTELNRCIEKIRIFSPEGYYISDIDDSVLDLSKVFVMRAELYLEFGDNVSFCNDLREGLKYVASEKQKENLVLLVDENCQ